MFKESQEGSTNYCNHTTADNEICDKCLGKKEQPKEWESEFDKIALNQDGTIHMGGSRITDLKQFIQDLLTQQEQGFKKILNSGRKMYEIGRKDIKKEIIDFINLGDEIDDYDKALISYVNKL